MYVYEWIYICIYICIKPFVAHMMLIIHVVRIVHVVQVARLRASERTLMRQLGEESVAADQVRSSLARRAPDVFLLFRRF